MKKTYVFKHYPPPPPLPPSFLWPWDICLKPSLKKSWIHPCSFPLRSGMHQLRESLQLGMGAHGWVVEICQPWGSILSRGWLTTVEAPGYPSHPPST